MDAPAGLEAIKFEKRHRYFVTQFGDQIEREKARCAQGGSLSPAFLCEAITAMLVYTSQDLQQHNEIVEPEDVRRISCYYFIELIQKIFGKNLESPDGWAGVDHLSILYYSMLLVTRAKMGKYNIDYLLERNRIMEEKAAAPVPVPAAQPVAVSTFDTLGRAPSVSARSMTFATTAKETTAQVNNLLEMSATEMAKPVATGKTRSRLSELLGFQKKDKKEKAALKQGLPMNISFVTGQQETTKTDGDIQNQELI